MTKKKKIILICISSMLAIVLIVTTIFLATRTPKKEEKPENSHPVSSDVNVEIPKVDDTPSIPNPDKPKDTELTVDVDDVKSTVDEKIPAEKKINR